MNDPFPFSHHFLKIPFQWNLLFTFTALSFISMKVIILESLFSIHNSMELLNVGVSHEFINRIF